MPDNQDSKLTARTGSSPIRDLFKENEDAYNKHHDSIAEGQNRETVDLEDKRTSEAADNYSVEESDSDQEAMKKIDIKEEMSLTGSTYNDKGRESVPLTHDEISSDDAIDLHDPEKDGSKSDNTSGSAKGSEETDKKESGFLGRLKKSFSVFIEAMKQPEEEISYDEPDNIFAEDNDNAEENSRFSHLFALRSSDNNDIDPESASEHVASDKDSRLITGEFKNRYKKPVEKVSSSSASSRVILSGGMADEYMDLIRKSAATNNTGFENSPDEKNSGLKFTTENDENIKFDNSDHISGSEVEVPVDVDSLRVESVTKTESEVESAESESYSTASVSMVVDDIVSPDQIPDETEHVDNNASDNNSAVSGTYDEAVQSEITGEAGNYEPSDSSEKNSDEAAKTDVNTQSEEQVIDEPEEVIRTVDKHEHRSIKSAILELAGRKETPVDDEKNDFSFIPESGVIYTSPVASEKEEHGLSEKEKKEKLDVNKLRGIFRSEDDLSVVFKDNSKQKKDTNKDYAHDTDISDEQKIVSGTSGSVDVSDRETEINSGSEDKTEETRKYKEIPAFDVFSDGVLPGKKPPSRQQGPGSPETSRVKRKPVPSDDIVPSFMSALNNDRPDIVINGAEKKSGVISVVKSDKKEEPESVVVGSLAEKKETIENNSSEKKAEETDADKRKTAEIIASTQSSEKSVSEEIKKNDGITEQNVNDKDIKISSVRNEDNTVKDDKLVSAHETDNDIRSEDKTFRIASEINTEKSNPSYLSDDLPGGEGIKVIPWTAPKSGSAGKELKSWQPKSIMESGSGKIEDEPDFSEGYISGLTYHESTAVPFVVMAGKFTKTLRGEYEAVRIYLSTMRTITSPGDDSDLAAKDSVKISEKTDNEKTGRFVSVNKGTRRSHSIYGSESDNYTGKTSNNSVTDSVGTVTKLSGKKQENIETGIQSGKSGSTKKKDTINQTSSDKKRSVSKNDNNKKSIRSQILSFFNTEEKYDPDDYTVEKKENKSPIDDYNSEGDEESIKTEINSNISYVSMRTILMLALSIGSAALVIISQCSPLFKYNLHNGWLVYALICFAFFVVAAIASRMTIVRGLLPLLKFKANSDTPFAVGAFAAAIQSVCAIFTPDKFMDGTMYIYVPLSIFALFLCSLGKLLILIRVRDNFRFLTKTPKKYVGKLYTDVGNAEKMVRELPSHKPLIGYTKQTGFASNFLQLSYTPDPGEEIAVKIAPIVTVIALISGILYGLFSLDFVGGVSSFTLVACIGTPIISLVSVNLPLMKLCSIVNRKGAMITSYETVRQFCDTNAIMIDSSQLYPKGCVTMSGMKTFKQTKLDDAISAGAAIMYAVNGSMAYAFENIIQFRKDRLPKVESVVYEDGKGLVGWVNDQRVLIGNRMLLESHNIKPPSIDIEERYRKNGSEITYISMSGELIAMFMLKYTADPEIVHELRNLEDNGVSFIVRTVDSNITKEMIAENFYLFHRCVTVLPTGLGNICHDVMSSSDDRSRAYLVTRGKISSFAKAVTGCIRMEFTVNLTNIIQYIAVILGLLIVTVISFVSGFEKLGCLEMLLYMIFWAAGTLSISVFRK